MRDEDDVKSKCTLFAFLIHVSALIVFDSALARSSRETNKTV